MMKFFQSTSLSLVLFSFLLFPSFANTPKEAREKLAQMGIVYSKDVFISCAAQGNTDAVTLFLDAGMDPNTKDSNDWTALLEAAQYGKTNTVQVLVERGAKVNAKRDKGKTALMYA